MADIQKAITEILGHSNGPIALLISQMQEQPQIMQRFALGAASGAVDTIPDTARIAATTGNLYSWRSDERLHYVPEGFQVLLWEQCGTFGFMVMKLIASVHTS